MNQPTYGFRPATRSEAKPLIGLYSESGAGKTYSALLLARGHVGPEGRIGMIETESGRGEAYADPTEYPEFKGPGDANYEVLPLRGDFSAAAYGKAITAAEEAKLDALIIDSASHEWEGVGGVLDQAAANGAAGKKGVLMWQRPKMDHQKHFMLRFMQTPIPIVILCMRAKYPMKEIPDPKNPGRKTWVRLGNLEPKQSDDILHEMFVHGWIARVDHAFHLTKCTAKALEPVFKDGAPITVETGRALAEWARGAPRAPAAETKPPAAGAFNIAVWDGSTRTCSDAMSWLADMKKCFQTIKVGSRVESFMAENTENIAAVRAEHPDVAQTIAIAFDDRVKELTP